LPLSQPVISNPQNFVRVAAHFSCSQIKWQGDAANVAPIFYSRALPNFGLSSRGCAHVSVQPPTASAKAPVQPPSPPMNTPESLRQHLARLADLQAALDALRTDLTIQLKETQTNA